MGIEHLFNIPATVLRPAPRSGAWGEAGVYIEVAVCKCRLVRLSGKEYADGRIRGEATHKAFLPGWVAIQASDRLRVGQTVYDVVPPVDDAGGGLGHHLEALLKERL